MIDLNRSREYYRYHRIRVICRKAAILRLWGGQEEADAWTHGQRGRLSKGKIHCSCPMCRRKSYDELSHREAKAISALESQRND